MNNVCKTCGHPLPSTANRVSVYGMFECHLFQKFSGRSVDEIISAWVEDCAEDHPCKRRDGSVFDMGPSALCPAGVFCDDKELREVGRMVHSPEDAEQLEAYREALKADPDIERILQEKSDE